MGLKVFISGQKFFAEQVLRKCLEEGHDVVAVACPLGDKYIGRLASINNIKIIPSGSLNGDTCPECDLGIAAHSFDYIGKRTRYKPRFGWIGYHPSLLPRHRGRSSIEWAIRMGDPITGGTVYWLNAGVDTGAICCQDWCFIHPTLMSMKPKEAARELWRTKLLDIGVDLIIKALRLIDRGEFVKTPQDHSLATFEPAISDERLPRPDALMIGAGG